MTDCGNVEVRELLPDLVHGRIAPRDRARVDAHVQGCANCAAELAFLRAAHGELRRPVPVDVARIVRALPPAPGGRRALGAGRPPASGARRSWLRAAAALLIVGAGGAGVVVVRSARDGAPVTAVSVPRPESPAAARELLVSSDIDELDDAALASLLLDIEALGAADALPSEEPSEVVPGLLDEGGA